MVNWNELLIRTTDIDAARLLAEWDWLLGGQYHPVVMTAFGDWFLQDDEGRIHFLDLVAGKLTKVADSGEAFRDAMKTPEKLDEWFIAELVALLVESGVVLGPNQCYGYRVPPVLGGKLEVGNIEPTDLMVHQSLLSQIHRQTKDLPVGTVVNKVLIDDQEP